MDGWILSLNDWIFYVSKLDGWMDGWMMMGWDGIASLPHCLRLRGRVSHGVCIASDDDGGTYERWVSGTYERWVSGMEWNCFVLPGWVDVFRDVRNVHRGGRKEGDVGGFVYR